MSPYIHAFNGAMTCTPDIWWEQSKHDLYTSDMSCFMPSSEQEITAHMETNMMSF